MHGLPAVERAPVVTPGPDGGFAVVAALCKVMAALPNIGKDDKSPEGYSYRGIEAITRHVQQLFAEHGVLPVPQAEVLATVSSPAMKDGWQDVLMRVEWTLVGLDGSTITAVTNGIGRDRSDKGANKAQTQAFKYLLLPLLLIADKKDDADGQTYEADRAPDQQAATTEQVAEFHETLNRLGDVQKAALKAWFAKNRIPKVERATADQAARAVTKAHELLSSTPAPVEEPPGEVHGPQEPAGVGA
jgi:hypothetical protein